METKKGEIIKILFEFPIGISCKLMGCFDCCFENKQYKVILIFTIELYAEIVNGYPATIYVLKVTTKTSEKGVKYVQNMFKVNKVVFVFLLLTSNIFHTFF